MKKKYGVGGMSCAACAAGIEKNVSRVDGVSEVTVSLLDRSMTVTFVEPATEESVLAAVTVLGYTVFPYGEEQNTKESDRLKRRFIRVSLTMMSVIFSLNNPGVSPHTPVF